VSLISSNPCKTTCQALTHLRDATLPGRSPVSLQEFLAHKKTPSPLGPPRTLGIGLRWALRGVGLPPSTPQKGPDEIGGHSVRLTSSDAIMLRASVAGFSAGHPPPSASRTFSSIPQNAAQVFKLEHPTPTSPPRRAGLLLRGCSRFILPFRFSQPVSLD